MNRLFRKDKEKKILFRLKRIITIILLGLNNGEKI